MSTPVNITNGTDTVDVTESALRVTQFPSDEEVVVPIVKPFTVDGDGVTVDLTVDGSTTPISAFIEADADGDVFITEINVVLLATIGGGNSLLRDYGAITDGLTNGCVLFENINGTIFEFREFPIKTNFNWVTLGTLTASLGEDAAAFRLKDVLPGNNSFGYNPRLDMRALKPPFGLRLKALSPDQLGIIIQDNLDVAGVSAFQVNAIGFKKLSR